MEREFIPVSSPSLTELEREYVIDAFDSSWISSTGKYLDRFEKRFSEDTGAAYSLAVTNGTVALHLALAALDVGHDDEVIVPSLTYIATANAVTYCGARAVFAEVSPVDWGIDVDALPELLTDKTRGVIAVHLYGQPVDMIRLRKFCNDHNLFLVEDAAEAPFASRDGKRVGELGDITTYSFYGNKVLAAGEGGAVTTSDRSLADRMKLLRGQGMDPERRYFFPVVGYNFRMTNLVAALLCGQLERQTELIEKRNELFDRYTKGLQGLQDIGFQPCAPDTVISPWLFCITAKSAYSRDALMEYLREANVDSRPFFISVHDLPPYVNSKRNQSMHYTEELSGCGINLPTYPDLSLSDVDYICDCIKTFTLST